MNNRAFCFATLLLYLSAFTIAAPPLNKPSSLVLSIANSTLPPPNNISLGASDVFPPREELPDDRVFYYHVSSTNLFLRFTNWHQSPSPLTVGEGRAALHAAMWETIARPEGALLPDHRSEWASGATVVEVAPNDAALPDEHRGKLTWGLWLRTIRGLSLWWRAYPGLYTGFEIYEGEWQIEESFLGSGQLTGTDLRGVSNI